MRSSGGRSPAPGTNGSDDKLTNGLHDVLKDQQELIADAMSRLTAMNRDLEDYKADHPEVLLPKQVAGMVSTSLSDGW